MKKLYSTLFIFGLLCAAPAFSMTSDELEARRLQEEKATQAIFYAITGKKGVAEVNNAIQNGANVNGTVTIGEHTPLHVAVLWNRPEIVERLLQQEGINADARDTLGKTPLDTATKLGNDCLKFLVAYDQKIKNSKLSLWQRWENFPDFSKGQSDYRKYCNIIAGFLANLYPYKTTLGALASNLGSFYLFKKSPRKYSVDKNFWGKESINHDLLAKAPYALNLPFLQIRSDYVHLRQFIFGAAAGWATKKIVPYAWSAVKKLRR